MTPKASVEMTERGTISSIQEYQRTRREQTVDSYVTFRRPDDIDLTYQLPPFVDALKKSWLSSLQSAAVVSSLLAGTAATLLSAIKADAAAANEEPEDTSSPFKTASASRLHVMYIASYGAIIFSIGATVMSLFLIDRIGDMPSTHEDENIRYVPRDTQLLSRYGAGDSWKAMFLCLIIFLSLAVLSIFFQVMSYVWLQESLEVKITVTLFVACTLVPLAYFLLRGWIRSRNDMMSKNRTT